MVHYTGKYNVPRFQRVDLGNKTLEDTLNAMGLKSRPATVSLSKVAPKRRPAEEHYESMIQESEVRPVILDEETLLERWTPRRRTTRKTTTEYLSIVERQIDRDSARRAEMIVRDYERNRLSRAGRKELATRVRDVSQHSGYGYDIQSYTTEGRVVRIEVKSFKGRKFANLILTSNEWKAAQKYGKHYWIYVVFRPQSKSPEIHPLHNFVRQAMGGQFLVEPYTYVISRIG